jgi:prepilin-type N-terminal cleavage/methylation domain-containing protein
MYKKGFTLIELLIVIGIIAILTAVVIITVAPGERLAEARDATRTKHINALESALYVYAIDNDTYPATITETLTEICNTNLASPSCSGLIDLSATGIIIPVDPQGSDDPNGTGYRVALIEGRLYFDALKSEGTGSSPPVVLSWEVPVGAEAYDKDGNLVISLEETGEINTQEAGMIVFKTAKDYGEITAVPGEYEVLVVAGGGGGGGDLGATNNEGAGGGAGGFIDKSGINAITVNTTSVAVEVGDGGAGANAATTTGSNGENTTFGSLVALGGGGGGTGNTPIDGADGGSGGGGSNGQNGNSATGGSATQPGSASGGYGYAGGNVGGVHYNAGAGGGGAGGIGGNPPSSGGSDGIGGNGGLGKQISGGWYASGGAGAGRGGHGTASAGGGGDGGTSPEDGVSNTGGGGGGGYAAIGGKGGSGIVIVRWGGYSYDFDPQDYN